MSSRTLSICALTRGRWRWWRPGVPIPPLLRCSHGTPPRPSRWSVSCTARCSPTWASTPVRRRPPNRPRRTSPTPATCWPPPPPAHSPKASARCCPATGSTGRSASTWCGTARRTLAISAGSTRTGERSSARRSVRCWPSPTRSPSPRPNARPCTGTSVSPPGTSGCSGTWATASKPGRPDTAARQPSEGFFRRSLVGTTVSSVAFRNMSSEDEQQGEFDVTDPKAMRALAHPVRTALLELLRIHQTLTATQASELLGETPANCAFHLRTLAKYGFVEEAGGGKGRERPWRQTYDRMSWRSRVDDPQASQATEALEQVWLDRSMSRARHSLTSATRWPKGLENALGATTTRLYVTAEEADQLYTEISQAFQHLLGPQNRFRDRRDPKLRPADAIPVEFVLMSYPVLDLPPLPEVGAGGEGS